MDKFRLGFSCLLFLKLYCCVNAQGIENIEELYAGVVFGKITVFDDANNEIEIEELKSIVYSSDTAFTSCLPTSEFINLQYFPYGVFVVTYSNTFDTITNNSNPSKIDFYRNYFDDNGNWMYRKFAFRTDKERLGKVKNLEDKEVAKGGLITEVEESWQIEKYVCGGKKFALDSCLLNYSLKLDSTGNFQQSISGHGEYRTTNSQTPFDLGSSSIKHLITFSRGLWISDDARLFFYSQGKVFEINYLLIGKDELVFQLMFDCQVYLKKVD
jgi:hypothetical protein